MPNAVLEAPAAALAQVAPTDLYGQIVQYGLLGVLFVLVVYALIKRDKDLTEERAARLSDALAMRDLIRADTEAKVAGIKLQEEHNRLMETLARNQELLVATSTNLVNQAIAHDVEQAEKIIGVIRSATSELKAGQK